MGCGSSKRAPVAGRIAVDEGKNEATRALAEAIQVTAIRDLALASHLSVILNVPLPSLDIAQYCTTLKAEGCDSTDDFDELEIEELREMPFCFKRLHLKKVGCARFGIRCSWYAGVWRVPHNTHGLCGISHDVTYHSFYLATL